MNIKQENQIEVEENKIRITFPKVKYEKIYRYDFDGNLIKIYNSIAEVTRELQCSPDSIRQACSGNSKYSHDSIWSYTPLIFSTKDLIAINFSGKKIPVKCIDNMGNEKTYNSISEASKETKISYKIIKSLCKSYPSFKNGYSFKYA